MDQQFIRTYLKRIWQPYTEEVARDLGLPEELYLVIDSFSGHKTDEVNHAMQEVNTDYTLIPGGVHQKCNHLT